MSVSALKQRYTAANIEDVFVGGQRGAGGSADERVLERFFEPLKKGELQDDAIIAYGMHLMHTDNREYVKAWVHAMHDLADRNPQMASQMRLRPRLNYQQLVKDEIEIPRIARHHALFGVAEVLREIYTPENSENTRLLELIRKLDHAT